jgi:asparagine synthase (glutamine-hydrolysing)
MGPLEPDDFSDIFEAPLSPEELFSEATATWDSGSGLEPVDRALEYFTHHYLQDDILAKVDRAAMMNSLEARSVFLDNDLVGFCERLPHQLKFRRGERKYLLKKAARGLLPDAIIHRPKKGFGMPLARWLRATPEPRPLAIPGIRPAPIQRRWAEHRRGGDDHRLLLWSALSLESTLARSHGAEPLRPSAPAAPALVA